MKSLTLFIIALISQLALSQTIERFSIDNGGTLASVGNIEIIYTIGEVNVQEFNIGGIQVSEGFINGGLLETLAIQQPVLQSSIVVYPNPTSETINISSTIPINKIELYDLLGKLVLTTKEVNKVKINQLETGTYFLKLISEKGNGIKKIIIK